MLKIRKQYQLEISNRFTALEKLRDSEDIKRVWQNIKQNIKTSAKDSLGLYELKQHKTWFDEECSGFENQRKQDEIQWLQDPNQSNVDSFHNVRREASRYFSNKKKEYLKTKIAELVTNSKIKKYQGMVQGHQ